MASTSISKISVCSSVSSREFGQRLIESSPLPPGLWQYSTNRVGPISGRSTVAEHVVSMAVLACRASAAMLSLLLAVSVVGYAVLLD
jgi:hypothetical protein